MTAHLKDWTRERYAGLREVLAESAEYRDNMLPEFSELSEPDSSLAKLYVEGRIDVHMHLVRSAEESLCALFHRAGPELDLEDHSREPLTVHRDYRGDLPWSVHDGRMDDAMLVGVPEFAEDPKLVAMRPSPSMVRLQVLDLCDVSAPHSLEELSGVVVPVPVRVPETQVGGSDSLESADEPVVRPWFWLRGDCMGLALDVFDELGFERVQLLVSPPKLRRIPNAVG